MPKIYVLVDPNFSVLGVYTTLKKAREESASYDADTKAHVVASIWEHKLDAPYEVDCGKER